jgi:hypothetical protein
VRSKIALAIAAAALGACTPPSSRDIDPSYVSPVFYQNHTCQQLEQEAATIGTSRAGFRRSRQRSPVWRRQYGRRVGITQRTVGRYRTSQYSEELRYSVSGGARQAKLGLVPFLKGIFYDGSRCLATTARRPDSGMYPKTLRRRNGAVHMAALINMGRIAGAERMRQTSHRKRGKSPRVDIDRVEVTQRSEPLKTGAHFSESCSRSSTAHAVAATYSASLSHHSAYRSIVAFCCRSSNASAWSRQSSAFARQSSGER